MATFRTVVPAVVVTVAWAALLVAQGGCVSPRVFDTGTRAFTDFDAMLADAAGADVVFVGEEPGQTETHRLELAVLEGLAGRGRDVIVAMEMFDRDAQDPLDHFLMGHLTEADFLAAARPSPRYATDYKPLVDVAIRRGWPVIATNAPRALAAEVAQGGLDVLKTKSDADRALVARDVRCATDDLAQCLRAETIAETIAQVLIAGATGGERPLVVSVNSASLSDFGGGAVARARRRLPDKRLLVLSVVPVKSLDALPPEAGPPHRGDYVVYVTETVKR